MAEQLLATEVNIDITDDFTVREWSRPVNNPDDLVPAVVIFLADGVHAALRNGHDSWTNYRGTETLTVTQSGYATVTLADGRQLVYELFPARINDDEPYNPPVYVGRWPD
ncbi:hypothetical protein [Mycolicibacterium sp.]|uniref:hypothetical protein n=1 Tax=Mycolicibacterium sp. TaxID=2320850 RepID=UPI0037C74B95